jgi:hypothetical protein
MNFLKARLVYFKLDPSIGEVALQVGLACRLLRI